MSCVLHGAGRTRDFLSFVDFKFNLYDRSHAFDVCLRINFVPYEEPCPCFTIVEPADFYVSNKRQREAAEEGAIALPFRQTMR